jgi:transposase
LGERTFSTGHEVRLLNARHVKAFIKGNKNDFNDAEAIFDTVSRPNTRTIAIKTVAQQSIQLIHSSLATRCCKKTNCQGQSDKRVIK